LADSSARAGDKNSHLCLLAPTQQSRQDAHNEGDEPLWLDLYGGKS
jgi:hypothetical protein